ncbi:MAG: sigma-70 family RNA polymerase sigma factor [Dissulfurimicrobium sp.]|nr:FliA/WhiG family RNA polymerase sigma factor [Dissulfurimicrobium hydrothermale]UKL13482.1 FliA/WhiG family RNA polymerase sigma factor [Dissulfurimicrobium hydrothermale]
MENGVLKDYTDIFFNAEETLTREKRQELIIRYTPLIRYVVEKMSARLPGHVSCDDLMSAGVIGLMDAVEKFDPSKNIQFKTYAEFRIRGAILDELRNLDWIPRSIRRKSSELEQTYKRLEKELGRPAEDEEAANALGLDMEEFYKLLEETRCVTFMDIDAIRRRLPDGNDEDIFDLIAGDGSADPFEQLKLTDIKRLVVDAIESLPIKERLVLSLYYYEELTMKEIGEIMGYTESRISQLHTKAILRIKAHISDNAGHALYDIA